MSGILDIIKNLKESNYEIYEFNLEVGEMPQNQIIQEVQNEFDFPISIILDKTLGKGFRLIVNDKVFDFSEKTLLKKLKKHITLTEIDKDLVDDVYAGLQHFSPITDEIEEGKIIEVKDGVAIISGLNNCINQELLITENDINLNAFNLEKDRIGAMIMGDYSSVKVGMKVTRTKKVLSIGVSDQVLGRVFGPLLEPLDGKSKVQVDEWMPIENQAPGVMERIPVDVPLQTGIKVIDALVPIGRGQRELIIGDRQTGKTSLAIDTIINQKGNGVICIYVSVGQKESKLARIIEELKQKDCLEYCVFIDAPGAAPASLQYLAPYSGTAIAEYFAKKGRDVLIIYDDLSKHAVAYREISLILNRPPGREAYPGDVFYLHSRLLERSCRLAPEYGGGSITSLPIIETLAGDISAYIPTNVISITDGQIFLETDLFNKGLRPAINPGLSVSRVGSAAQTKAMKKVAGSMKLALAQYRELEAFSQFSAELDSSTRYALEKGQKLQLLLTQKNGEPVRLADQVLTFYLVNNGGFDQTPKEKVIETLDRFLVYVNSQNPELIENLDKGIWPDGVEEELKDLISKFLLTNE